MTENICNFKNALDKPTNYPCSMAYSLCRYNYNGKLECPQMNQLEYLAQHPT